MRLRMNAMKPGASPRGHACWCWPEEACRKEAGCHGARRVDTQLPVGPAGHLVWHPSAAYVVAIGEDSLSYVDTTTGAVIASIPPPHVRSPHRLLYRRHPYGHNVIRQCASCLEFDARTASLRDRARSDRPGHPDEPAGHRPRRSSLRGPDTDPLQHPVGAGICITISDQRLHGRPTSRPRFTGCQA